MNSLLTCLKKNPIRAMKTRSEVREQLAGTPRPWVKICGMMKEEDAAACDMADLIGLIFHPKSRRFVDAKRARRIVDAASPDTLTVGVFVDKTEEEILALRDQAGFDIVQLHGSESPKLIENLQKKDIFVIRAFRIDDDFPEKRREIEENPADLVLLDAAEPGSGKSFTWEDIDLARDYLLAGGLSAKNLKRAETFRPAGFDLSSGAETAGAKDPAKIKEILTIGYACKQNRAVLRP